MKTKPCIFVFFLCELILISVVAIKSSIDEKQSSATKEYKTKIELDMDECWSGKGGYWGREHGDVDMGGWLGKGTPRRRGMGGSGGENKGASGEEVNESPGGKGGGGHKGGSGGSEKEGPGGEGGGEQKGPGGGEGGGIENGDHVEHP